MNLTRVKAVSRKEFIQIWRDPRSLALAILIPIMLLLLFGYALTFDVENVRIAVWNQDKSQTSVNFLLNFKNSRYFKIIGYYENYEPLENLISKNEILAAVIIPKNFSENLKGGRSAALQVLVDASDSNTATIAMGYFNSIVSRYNSQLLAKGFNKLNIEFNPPLELRSRVWFNPDLKSRNFIIPGLIAVIIMIIAALLTSLTFAREWERGTMEQLISTPVKPGEMVLGKFLPYFAIGFVDLLISMAAAQFIYHVPLRGSIVLVFIVSAIFLTGALSLGILISIVTKNQLIASQLAIITTFLPAFLLSGFAYPILNMPKVIQMITYVITARYFIFVLRSIYLKGVGLTVFWLDVVFLLLFAILMVTLAIRKFKKVVK